MKFVQSPTHVPITILTKPKLTCLTRRCRAEVPMRWTGSPHPLTVIVIVTMTHGVARNHCMIGTTTHQEMGIVGQGEVSMLR